MRISAKISLSLQIFLVVIFSIRDALKLGGMVGASTDIISGASLVFLFSYLLGRFYSPRTSTVLALFTFNYISYSLILSHEVFTREIAFGALVWVSWSLVLASFLLELRWAAGFTLLNLLLVFLMPLLIPNLEYMMLTGTVSFIAGIAAIALLGSWLLSKSNMELKEAQDQVIKNERLAVLGRLSGGVGHELRNPLAAMKNSVYFLRMALEDSDDVDITETLDILDFEILTSETIINSLLDYARPKPPVRTKTNVHEVLETALSRVTIPTNVEVVKQLSQKSPVIIADSVQLSRVFVNLYKNGIQAMPEGGNLGISATTEPNWISIKIADTGSGISKENMDHLFEPLFTTKARGIGLGLVIVKVFVESHHGTVEISSEVGQGTEVTVKLPYVLQDVE
jgi:signal transduction histidine kinase